MMSQSKENKRDEKKTNGNELPSKEQLQELADMEVCDPDELLLKSSTSCLKKGTAISLVFHLGLIIATSVPLLQAWVELGTFNVTYSEIQHQKKEEAKAAQEAKKHKVIEAKIIESQKEEKEEKEKNQKQLDKRSQKKDAPKKPDDTPKDVGESLIDNLDGWDS